MTVYIGTSGYSYKEWKGRFYPEKIAGDEMLQFYSHHFKTVEINNTFYRMPTQQVITGWERQVGDDFRFVLKASRRITHMKRLRNAGDELLYFLEAATMLGDKLGPLLFQLPPNFKADAERLDAFLTEIPPGWRVALEFRHPSWDQEETSAILRRHHAAWVTADTGEGKGEGKRTHVAMTTDWGYLRLRSPNYSDSDLAVWAERIKTQEWRDVYVFFKHEDEAMGPKMAKRFEALF